MPAPAITSGPIDDYIVYYGKGEAKLPQFDLAIVQPETLTSAKLAQVQAAGTKRWSPISTVSSARPKGDVPGGPKLTWIGCWAATKTGGRSMWMPGSGLAGFAA